MTATCPDIGVMIRISVSNENARFVLGNKFGCSPTWWTPSPEGRRAGRTLSALASTSDRSTRTLRASSMHEASRAGLHLAVEPWLLKCAHDQHGVDTHRAAFVQSRPIIQSNMNPNLQYIAEPGRFLSRKAATYSCKSRLKRTLDGNTVEYTMNDGLYGSLNCNVYDLHASATLTPTSSSVL